MASKGQGEQPQNRWRSPTMSTRTSWSFHDRVADRAKAMGIKRSDLVRLMLVQAAQTMPELAGGDPWPDITPDITVDAGAVR